MFIYMLYGTEVPRSKLGLDLRPDMDPECDTKMLKCELGLRLRIGRTYPYLISLLCTTLISYKSESRSLTNTRLDFPQTTKKGKPDISWDAWQFLGNVIAGHMCLSQNQVSKPQAWFLNFHLNIHLEQITLDLTTRHICLSWNQVSKPQTTIFHSHLNDHLKRITLDLKLH